MSGVVPVVPPEFVSVSLPSVQVAVQAVLRRAGWRPLSRSRWSRTEAGLLIVWTIMQLAFAVGVPVEVQKPALLALAAVTPTVIMPAASNPVKVALKATRLDLCIINCLSAFACPPSPHGNDALAWALVYTRFTGWVRITAIYARLDKSERRKAF